jgi:hypothetical protein
MIEGPNSPIYTSPPRISELEGGYHPELGRWCNNLDFGSRRQMSFQVMSATLWLVHFDDIQLMRSY